MEKLFASKILLTDPHYPTELFCPALAYTAPRASSLTLRARTYFLDLHGHTGSFPPGPLLNQYCDQSVRRKNLKKYRTSFKHSGRCMKKMYYNKSNDNIFKKIIKKKKRFKKTFTTKYNRNSMNFKYIRLKIEPVTPQIWSY